MLLFTEFKVQCPRTVPDGVVWTDVQTAYRWLDTMSRRDPLLFVYPPTGGGYWLILWMPVCRCRPLTDAGHLRCRF